MPETVPGTNISAHDLGISIIIAIAISLLLAFIQIPVKSKTTPRACFVTQSFFYWSVLSIGNVVTTLLVSPGVTKLPSNLADYYFLFCPFFGVFGFEGILKNTNVTMFNSGVLTIKDWTDKALDAAAGAAIAKQEDIKQRNDNKIRNKLTLLSEEDINTLILDKMGDDVVEKLEEKATRSHANQKQYKILQLVATLTPSEARALLQSKK